MNRQINNPAVDGSPDLTFYQKKDNVCHTLLKVIKMYCCDFDKSIYANRQKESINTIDSGLTTRNKTFNEDSIAVSLFTNSRKGKRQLLSNSMCIVGQPRIHRWHPKFTFSTFTPDPNLQNPHLHKTQIYTNSNLHSSDLHTPKFTQPNIGIPKFTQLKFTQN